MGKTVLAVDDDLCVLALLREVLGLGSYRVATACAHDQANKQNRAAHPDLRILDLVLGEPAGGWAILEYAADARLASGWRAWVPGSA
jgi:DNA-binding NtrC family response regulator